MKLRAWEACAVLALSSAAWAQTDAATAQALFDRARELMAAGKYADACPKLAESERLDPGVGTLLNLGDCYDKNGQLALAWATFREADALANRQNQSDRMKYARRRASEIEKRLAMLTVEVPGEARVSGIEVLRDGEVLREPLWNTRLPVDPGKHTITARAPGYKPYTLEVDATRDTPPITIPPLEKLPDEAPPVTPPPVTPPPPPREIVIVQAPPPPAPSATGSGSGQRTVGIVLTGVGIVGVATGLVFGAFAMTRESSATSAGCDRSTCPTAESLQTANDALTFARVSTWTIVASAVVTGVGLTVWLTSPRASQTAWLAPSLGGAALGGSF